MSVDTAHVQLEGPAEPTAMGLGGRGAHDRTIACRSRLHLTARALFAIGHVAERRHSRMSLIANSLHLSSFDDKSTLLPFDDIQNIMKIRTPLDLGLAIRGQRRKLKLSQSELARKAGVGRQWIVAIEHGKSRAELGLVLRTLSALDLPLTIHPGDRLPRSSDDMTLVDIDAVINDAKEDRR